MLPSPSLQSPPTEPSSSHRPASAAVPVQPPSASSSRRHQRASHTVVSTQQGHQSTTTQDSAPYTDVYSHPAAVAYATAHPRRTIPKFGPYLLLQTLGEGEFGKVKLGLHCQWGEEVAVKLIRRGTIDTAVRMSKVEREIEVLRTLKHPNIVRLYDVIETDKYIGIILEYASGGELFDHILAHRYLRERDAAKLFSQLISGVWYIHQKKIVHRDLKLENLLLDRHRNVIITDFGFANRFEHRSDDLMQTSCGSPCYAAPELVISEGLYVGSAVDIWSCGVILYAMLAGYLPFDDDPDNPDGDNINLLYKYIVNTPLSFPDYISSAARDLLGMMLVPDPTRRSSLEGIMRHPWLSAYSTPRDGTTLTLMVPSAFGRSVEQLEHAAMEQHQQKRLAYQRQMKAAALAASHHGPSAQAVGRSHSSYVAGGSGHRAAATEPGGRSHSTQPEYLYDSSVDLTLAVAPTSAASTSSSSGKKKIGYSGDDDPFGPPPSSGPATAKTQLLGVGSAEPPKSGKAGDFRHTIQVEYDEPKGHQHQRTRTSEAYQQHQNQSQKHQQKNHQHQNGVIPTPESAQGTVGGVQLSSGTSDATISKPLPPSPPPARPQPNIATQTTNGTPSTPKPPSVPVPTKNKAPSMPTQHIPPRAPPMKTPDISVEAASPPVTPEKDADANMNTRNSRGGKKDRLSMDKLESGKRLEEGAKAKQKTNTSSGASPTNSGSVSAKSVSSAASKAMGKERSNEEREKAKEKNTKKTPRRNTLTVMVEPFRIRNRGQKNSSGSTTSSTNATSAASIVRAAVGEQPQLTSPRPLATKEEHKPAPRFNDEGEPADNSVRSPGMPASTGKARRVMQWFRSRNKAPDASTTTDPNVEKHERSRTPTQNEYGTVRKQSATDLDTRTVQVPVVVTPSAQIQRSVSTATATTVTGESSASPATAQMSTSSLVTRFRNSVTIGGGHTSLSSKAASSAAKSHAGPWGVLRTHHGAVDQSTITTKAPPDVFRHVKEVLEGMGVEIYVESEYKFRCVRPKKRKGSIAVPSSGSGSGSVSARTSASSTGKDGNLGATGITAIAMVGSAASNGVDKRGLPVPSPSSFSGTGGMLRGLLSRRQSSQASGTSPTLGPLDDDIAVTPEPVTSGVHHETVYGDTSQDAGDEVRFSVELTRIDRLKDTFSLDLRRLKGNLRSYKFLYDTFRERADLQR